VGDNRVIKMKVGERYGKLICVRHIDNEKSEFLCNCGKKTIVRRCCVVNGNSKSCGCLRIEMVRRKKREWVPINRGRYYDIPLTKGKFTKIDKEDLELISGFSWRAKKAKTGKYYAVTERNGKTICMPNLIMKHIPDGRRVEVDHINNEDTLDNRKSNLRLVTNQQNAMNRKSRNKSGFKGVVVFNNRIQVMVKKCGKVVYRRYFKNGEEKKAAAAYRLHALKHHGEFANFDCIKKQ
jgi:hypothetical protein